MKILGIVGSMKKTGNTTLLVETVLESVRKTNPQVETKVLQISELKIEPCRGCVELCSKEPEPYKCVIEDDLQTVLEEMKQSQAIVIGSPLYYPIPSRLTAFMERLMNLSYFCEIGEFKEPEPLNDKPCGLVAVSAGSDPYPVLERLFNFALWLKMKPVILKSFPHLGVCGKGKVEEDKEHNPTKNAKVLGELLVKAIEGGL